MHNQNREEMTVQQWRRQAFKKFEGHQSQRLKRMLADVSGKSTPNVSAELRRQLYPLRMPKVLRSRIVESVASTAKEPSSFSGASDRIVDAIESASDRDLALADWLWLRTILTNCGFLRAASAARKHARSIALTNYAPSIRIEGSIKTRAAIDIGDLDRAMESYDRCPRNPTARDGGSDALGRYLRLWAIGRPDAIQEAARDRAFGDLIRDRSVAVVGPAQPNDPVGSEIDGFDVVARPSYFGPTSLGDTKLVGTRTNVSYYTTRQIRRINSDDRSTTPTDIEYMVLHPSEVPTPSSVPSRIAYSPRDALFITTPNKLPLMVFDLLQFRPKRLKILLNNFFLASNPYRNSYESAVVIESTKSNVGRRLCRAFARSHDQLSQLSLMRNLLISGAIEADDMCSTALSLSEESYSAGIESLYGFGTWFE